MSNVVAKWPEHINQRDFITDCSRMTTRELSHKYERSPHVILAWRGYLIREGLINPNPGPRRVLPVEKENEFIADTFKLRIVDMARKYNICARSVFEYKDRFKLRGDLVGHGQYPEPSGRVFDDWLKIKANRFITISDVEIPDHSPVWFELIETIAIMWEIPVLIINGDFGALDSLSKWMRQLASRTVLDDELSDIRAALTALKQVFSKIYYLMGNHERRLSHAIEGQLQFAGLIDVPGVVVSDFPYMEVDCVGEKWVIGHPDNYSRVPGNVPKTLFQQHLCHIISGHTHFLDQARDRSGRYYLIEGGCIRDPQRTAYKALRFNTYPAWNQGFVTVTDGLPTLIDRERANFIIGQGKPEEPLQVATRRGKR